ncbi:methylamine dehydrogenase [Candidatus Methylacidiphilum fumarolicum]|uniref:amine dehydrogenase large subunit n=1 Tax=Candidatus Methylacidiphilum fumarolicum TaxID=591154 RepID=UPI0011013FD5|nr:amine dehydrogenase large subunit [Candidatus Methylacidiphilum fumarolicum]TFE70149.1 methylamine dehydrogenase [Candidatus Methylacidiphilum fumarolicum]TFE75942.1 methylamine dehydrogenase [Candidatus Methylacidiphilum fumarolicum]
METFTTVSLPQPSVDQLFTVANRKAFLIDVPKKKVLGMIDLGYMGNIVLSSDRKFLYAVETFYSRGTRGIRTDVITVYDTKNLSVLHEIEIPPKRFLCVIKKNTQALSGDNRFLLVCNISPASSVSVVDLHQQRLVKEIPTPGYVLLYPYETRRFAMIGQDGGLLLLSLNKAGQVEEKKRIFPGFSLADPIFEHGVYLKSANQYYFVSYEGMLWSLSLSGLSATWEQKWNIASGSGWRPCGWQLLSCDPEERHFYILMHKAPKGKHKDSGTEVWEIGRDDGVVKRKIALDRPVDSIRIVAKEETLLCGLCRKAYLDIYDLRNGTKTAEIEELGEEALLLIGYDG